MFKSINGGILPQRATKYSAGFDVFANEDVTIGAGETVLVGLGIALDEVGIALYGDSGFETKHYFELHPRSSLRAKGLGGGVGIIDIDYRDEIKMVIHNHITWAITTGYGGVRLLCKESRDNDILADNYEIKKGDKIGQLILKRHEGYLMPSEYTKDEDRVGGFGSTGDTISQ